MEPGKTSFFQALGVPTKIARGTIEITTDLKLVEAGNKVGPSEATLLNMLNISPFTYGMGIAQVYDEGQAFAPEVLDIGEEQLLKTLGQAITTIATISLAISFPTLPSVLHSLVNSYKKVLAVAIETEISWPEIEELKDRIANPDAYASAAPVAAAADAGAAAPAAEEKKEEEEEDSDADMGFGLLYVPPMYCCLIEMLTALIATKRCQLFTVPGRVLGFRLLGLRFMDLKEMVHRSPALRLSLWQRSNQRRLMMKTTNFPLLCLWIDMLPQSTTHST
jgi:large subunit ribosomal protein LP0